MLLKVNFYNKVNSIYECDMCGKQINGIEVMQLFEVNNSHNRKEKKLFDLCPNCHKLVTKGVKKYKDKRKEATNEINR